MSNLSRPWRKRSGIKKSWRTDQNIKIHPSLQKQRDNHPWNLAIHQADILLKSFCNNLSFLLLISILNLKNWNISTRFANFLHGSGSPQTPDPCPAKSQIANSPTGANGYFLYFPSLCSPVLFEFVQITKRRFDAGQTAHTSKSLAIFKPQDQTLEIHFCQSWFEN